MSTLSMIADYVKGTWYRPPLDTTEEENVAGKVVVITGANSGIGEVTAIEMAKRGATVVLACRDMGKAQILQQINTDSPQSRAVLLELDLGDLSCVRKCAAEIRERFDHIDILINNAGVLYDDGVLRKTVDSFEAHIGVNHLGHFLFTMLLLDLVKKAAPSRIVITASMAHLGAELDVDDLMLEKRGSFGGGMGPYSNSKLANMYFAKALAKKLEGTGVRTYALCPGYVATNIFRHDPWYIFLIRKLTLLFSYTPEQGAETILFCALSKKCAQDTGKMYRFNQEWVNAMDPLNQETERKLWEVSEKLVGLA